MLLIEGVRRFSNFVPFSERRAQLFWLGLLNKIKCQCFFLIWPLFIGLNMADIIDIFCSIFGRIFFEIFLPLPSYELDQENVPGHKFGIKTVILILTILKFMNDFRPWNPPKRTTTHNGWFTGWSLLPSQCANSSQTFLLDGCHSTGSWR